MAFHLLIICYWQTTQWSTSTPKKFVTDATNIRFSTTERVGHMVASHMQTLSIQAIACQFIPVPPSLRFCLTLVLYKQANNVTRSKAWQMNTNSRSVNSRFAHQILRPDLWSNKSSTLPTSATTIFHYVVPPRYHLVKSDPVDHVHSGLS